MGNTTAPPYHLGGNANLNDTRRKQFEIRKFVRYVQVLLEELRKLPEENDYERPWLEEEVEKVVKILEGHLGVPRSSLLLDEDVYEDAKEYHKPSKQLRFAKPSVAFYEIENENGMSPTPMTKHASFEELDRHDDEMDRAYEEAQQNPRWYGGRRYSYSHY